MPSDYPTAAELVSYFSDNGYPTINETEAGRLLATAIGEFESLTYFQPFKAVSNTYDFDAPTASSNDGYRLVLDTSPFYADGLTVVHTSPTGAQTTLDVGDDFDLLPLSAGTEANPYIILRLNSYFGPGKIEMTGLFGFTKTIPQDVYDAVMEYAAELKLSRLAKVQEFSTSGRTVTKFKQGPIERQYDTSTSSQSILSDARSKLGEVAARYR